MKPPLHFSREDLKMPLFFGTFFHGSTHPTTFENNGHLLLIGYLECARDCISIYIISCKETEVTCPRKQWCQD